MNRPYCIAEIGGNHEGDFAKALDLVKLALSTPVDAIKFQTYYADSLVEKAADPSRWKHFKRFELTMAQHEKIANIIVSAGKDYLTSIWDVDAYKVLNKYLKHVKIGSGDMDSYSFLKLAAKTKKPIILSTGLSTLEDVKKSVKLLREFDAIYFNRSMITILQCTSMYPINFNEANLDVMNTYQNLGTCVGYSDHTVGTRALKVATMLGAKMLEFHFSDDNTNGSFRDHLVSLEPEQVGDLYQFFSDVDTLRGSPVKEPTESEVETGHVRTFRRGTYATHDLAAGTVIGVEDISEKRPSNEGLRYEKLLGSKLKEDVKKGMPIKSEQIDSVE
ncbi:N-acetylneuraminate synthase family protein [Planktomarina sp.]|nr:N-acetylneuraminate synthase family protein [Planktomarina sp.]